MCPAQRQAEIWSSGMGESIVMSQAQGQWVQEPSAGCGLSSAKAREVLVGPCPCPYLSVGTVTCDKEGSAWPHWVGFMFTQLFGCFWLIQERQDLDKHKIVLKVCCFASHRSFELLPPKKLLQHVSFVIYGIRRKLVYYQKSIFILLIKYN